MRYEITALVLLFSISYALYVGSGGQYAPGFAQFVSDEYNTDGQSIWENIFDSLGMSDLATTAVAGASLYFAGAGIGYAVAGALLIAISNKFLTPLSLINSINMPSDLGYLLNGILITIFVVAILGFMRGK